MTWATSPAILSSEIASGVSVGDDSIIYDSTLSSGVQIGSRCVVVAVHIDQNEAMLHSWENSQRVSLEEMHRSIDYQRLCAESSNHRSKLAAGIAKACISYGLLGRKLSRLCAEILEGEKNGTDICKSFLSLCPNPQTSSLSLLNLPQSRAYQAQVDLRRACKQEQSANIIEPSVWEAVASETAAAVRQELEDQASKPLNGVTTKISLGYEHHHNANSQPLQPKRAHVELPVRVDFVGGWSDTPPWSLERIGCVLNMAIHLEGTLPVGAEIVVTSKEGILIHDDAGNQLHIRDLRSIAPPFREDDQFRLVKAALTVTDSLVIARGCFQEVFGDGTVQCSVLSSGCCRSPRIIWDPGIILGFSWFS